MYQTLLSRAVFNIFFDSPNYGG